MNNVLGLRKGEVCPFSLFPPTSGIVQGFWLTVVEEHQSQMNYSNFWSSTSSCTFMKEITIESRKINNGWNWSKKKKEKKRNFKCYLKQKNINCDRSKKAILFELYYCNLNKGLRDHRNSELMIHISKKLQMTHLNIKNKNCYRFPNYSGKRGLGAITGFKKWLFQNISAVVLTYF